MVTSPRASDTADPAPALLKGPTGLHWSCLHRLMSPETQIRGHVTGMSYIRRMHE